MLRVLDADPVDVNLLPDNFFHLFHLRYLAIRCNYHNHLPWLSLQNLQTLIIHRKNETPFAIGTSCYLHWCMPRLRYVYFNGIIFFYDPQGSASSLENLHTLSYVSHSSCTERILKMIPSLKKLKVDSSYGGRGGDAAYLNDLVHLHQLETLEIYAGCWIDARPTCYKFSLPMTLKKLCLRDWKLSMDDMTVVGSLPDLRVLKLKSCVCTGGTLETTEGQFPRLEFLLIESLDFENWITESSHFPRLKHLLLHSCRYLNEIPNDIGEISTLQVIELKGDVKRSLVESAKEIQKEQEDMGNNTLRVVC